MRRARRDAGFSLAALIFFLTAASVTITFTAVPSYLMEAQREREKELIFRGEEYTRAIQKYQRTLNLLPNSADDLLASNGTRFLRKAYADPVSGEPWRMIILNSNGTLTGSNVYQTMSQVPTTTSQAFQPAASTAPKASGASIGTLSTTSPTSGGGGSGLQGGGGAAGAPGQPLGTGITGAGVGGGAGLQGATAGRPNPTGAVSPTSPAAPAQPQNQQAVPLQGWVGVGSASKGKGVMVYLKQEDYSNWEFLATLQQRTNGGTGGTGGTGGPGGASKAGGGAAGGTGGFGATGGVGGGGTTGGTGGFGGGTTGGTGGVGGATKGR